MCEYNRENASYVVKTRDSDGKEIEKVTVSYYTNHTEVVELYVKKGIQKDTQYTVSIDVQTEINSASIRRHFGKRI